MKRISIFVIAVILSLGLVSNASASNRGCRIGVGPQGPQGIPGESLAGPAGYTPIKDVDYFDGKNGANGKDGAVIVKHEYIEEERDEWRVEGWLKAKTYVTDRIFFEAGLGKNLGCKEKLGMVSLTYEIGKSPRDKRIEKLEEKVKRLER